MKRIAAYRLQTMEPQERKIVLELTEHDILCLLSLIRRELSQSAKPWKPYWQRMAQTVEHLVNQTEDTLPE